MRKHIGKIIYGVSALGVVIGFIHIDNKLIRISDDVYWSNRGFNVDYRRKEKDENIRNNGSLWDRITWKI